MTDPVSPALPRYRLRPFFNWSDAPQGTGALVAHPTGAWVKYAEVAARLDALEAQHEEIDRRVRNELAPFYDPAVEGPLTHEASLTYMAGVVVRQLEHAEAQNTDLEAQLAALTVAYQTLQEQHRRFIAWARTAIVTNDPHSLAEAVLVLIKADEENLRASHRSDGAERQDLSREGHQLSVSDAKRTEK